MCLCVCVCVFDCVLSMFGFCYSLNGQFVELEIMGHIHKKMERAAAPNLEALCSDIFNVGMHCINKNTAHPCVSPSAGAKKAA